MKGKSTPSEKSMTTSTTTYSVEESESRDSNCYFPGCRKDANCSCEICLDSINATLDLMPLSVQKSSLTRLSCASRCKSTVKTTPISFDPTVVTTPTSVSRPISRVSPPKMKKKQEAKSEIREEKEPMKKTKIKGTSGICVVLRMVMVLGLVFSLEVGFCWVIKGVFKPEFTEAIVKNAVHRSGDVQDLDLKLKVLEEEFKRAVKNRKLSSCRDSDSKWKINQGGLTLSSKCILYKSTTEEVSIWGWPLQTAKTLSLGFSSSSFTILSGRVTEWNDGKFGYSIREANASWQRTKWSTCVLQLDPNSWVLEYSRSSVLDSSSLMSLTLDLLRHMMFQAARNINRELVWLASIWENMYSYASSKPNPMTPT
ncbi:PREDICTED: uncharacterized protein LOC104800960 [Tarenaya hassleriana]|uniref:uncharacterized protein LOC104800960 n=1 Tax=Tarenaya hassleriana TaxID=28532 RepID=UPI00053CA627|nr:PREDICTED: uncharacterized protein LOC104800960 [Tarenaya hassleriana]